MSYIDSVKKFYNNPEFLFLYPTDLVTLTNIVYFDTCVSCQSFVKKEILEVR